VIHVRQLQKVFKEGREAIYTALRQLRDAGLLEMESYKEPGKPPKQRFVLADIDDLLSTSPDTDSWDAGKRDQGNRDTGSRGLNQYLLKSGSKKVNTDNNHSATFGGGEPKALSNIGARSYPQGYTQVDPDSGIVYGPGEEPPPF
jgi:hypothetical protein